MISVPFRSVLLSLIALVAIGSVISIQPKNTSSDIQVSEGPCHSNGVTVVIDFGQTNSEMITKCIQNFTGNGWQALQKAGVALTGTSEYPNSFVCRINEVPSPEQENCVGTPTIAEGTWVYFAASESFSSSGWLRSGQGATNRKPQCGDYEGWKFAANFIESKSAPRLAAETFTCESK